MSEVKFVSIVQFSPFVLFKQIVRGMLWK